MPLPNLIYQEHSVFLGYWVSHWTCSKISWPSWAMIAASCITCCLIQGLAQDLIPLQWGHWTSSARIELFAYFRPLQGSCRRQLNRWSWACLWALAFQIKKRILVLPVHKNLTECCFNWLPWAFLSVHGACSLLWGAPGSVFQLIAWSLSKSISWLSNFLGG